MNKGKEEGRGRHKSLRAWDHPVLATIRGVESLILKLAVTPALIGGASLAGRRWGAAVGGWLVGIPFTSAPIALFLALDHEVSFAASASVGMLLGTISQAIFCLAYSWSASRGFSGSRLSAPAAWASGLRPSSCSS
jgi:hypothetical protein